MEITFFIGSGISKKAGVPGVTDIDKYLFNETYLRNSPRRLEPWSAEEGGELEDSESAAPIQEYLLSLKKQHDRYLESRLGAGFTTNYEDLFSILDQVDEELMEVLDNYVLQDFIHRQKEESAEFRKRLHSGPNELSLKKFYMHCKFFIEEVLRLHVTVKKVTGVSAFESLLQNEKVSKLNIFSLNHDDLIEKACVQNKTTLIDGFMEPDGEVRLGNAYLYDNDAKVHLYKLHGGINWYWIVNRENGQQGYAIITGENKIDPSTDSDTSFTTMALDKNFLTGVNKLIAYNDGFFGELQYRFTTQLKKTDRLIMSGYGWNDRPLNRKLLDWLRINPNSKLLIIHNDGESMFKNSRYITIRRIQEEIRSKKIVFINKWFEEATADEIIDFIKS